MTKLVTVLIENQVATLTLNNGKVNAISHQVVDEFNQALDLAEQQKAVVVITGQAGRLPKVHFCYYLQTIVLVLRANLRLV